VPPVALAPADPPLPLWPPAPPLEPVVPPAAVPPAPLPLEPLLPPAPVAGVGAVTAKIATAVAGALVPAAPLEAPACPALPVAFVPAAAAVMPAGPPVAPAAPAVSSLLPHAAKASAQATEKPVLEAIFIIISFSVAHASLQKAESLRHRDLAHAGRWTAIDDVIRAHSPAVHTRLRRIVAAALLTKTNKTLTSVWWIAQRRR
jgi:hypothetical protein